MEFTFPNREDREYLALILQEYYGMLAHKVELNQINADESEDEQAKEQFASVAKDLEAEQEVLSVFFTRMFPGEEVNP